MSTFSELVSPYLKNHIGTYLREGMEVVAQETIKERGRFEPEFAPEDMTKFVKCMIKLTPSVSSDNISLGVICFMLVRMKVTQKPFLVGSVQHHS